MPVWKWAVVLSLLAAAGCGGESSSPPTTPAVRPRGAAVVAVSDPTVSGFRRQGLSTYVVLFRMGETTGVGATLTGVEVRFYSKGTLFWTTPYQDRNPVPGVMTMRDYEITDPDAHHPVADRIEITWTYSDANQHSGLVTVFSADVRYIDPVAITGFTADRTTLGPGETTVLRWAVSGADASVSLYPLDGAVQNQPAGTIPSLPASGTVTVRPCPGSTTFTLHATNSTGGVQATIEITESYGAGVISLCGTWTGSSNETWTDSLGRSGSSDAGIWLRLPQWDATVQGAWERTVRSGRGGGIPDNADLSGNLAGTGLTGTLLYRDRPDFSCPAALAATASDDGVTMSGRYSSACTIADGSRRVIEGTFSLRKERTSYVRVSPAGLPR